MAPILLSPKWGTIYINMNANYISLSLKTKSTAHWLKEPVHLGGGGGVNVTTLGGKGILTFINQILITQC